MMDDKVWTINMKERKGLMKIDNRTWIILALMISCAVYIGWLHVVIHDLQPTSKEESQVSELWPPVDARTDRNQPMTILERND